MADIYQKIAGIYNITHQLYFLFACFSHKKDEGSKVKVIILSSISSWLVRIPGYTSESQGAVAPAQGNCHSPSGVERRLEAATP